MHNNETPPEGTESAAEIERKLRVMIDKTLNLWPAGVKIVGNPQAYDRCVALGRTPQEVLSLFDLVGDWESVKLSQHSLSIFTAYATYAEQLLDGKL